jgi:hypothetical protein
MPQLAQKQMPVSSVGPLVIRGAVSAGPARPEQRLHRLELGRIDDRRRDHLDDLGFGLALARLPVLRNAPKSPDQKLTPIKAVIRCTARMPIEGSPVVDNGGKR